MPISNMTILIVMTIVAVSLGAIATLVYFIMRVISKHKKPK
jgi:heme/copper-type cytochrome/quinol oxidase subunit 2